MLSSKSKHVQLVNGLEPVGFLLLPFVPQDGHGRTRTGDADIVVQTSGRRVEVLQRVVDLGGVRVGRLEQETHLGFRLFLFSIWKKKKMIIFVAAAIVVVAIVVVAVASLD